MAKKRLMIHNFVNIIEIFSPLRLSNLVAITSSFSKKSKNRVANFSYHIKIYKIDE